MVDDEFLDVDPPDSLASARWVNSLLMNYVDRDGRKLAAVVRIKMDSSPHWQSKVNELRLVREKKADSAPIPSRLEQVVSIHDVLDFFLFFLVMMMVDDLFLALGTVPFSAASLASARSSQLSS